MILEFTAADMSGTGYLARDQGGLPGIPEVTGVSEQRMDTNIGLITSLMLSTQILPLWNLSDIFYRSTAPFG